MGWLIWFAIVALAAGTLLVWAFCQGVVDLVREKRGKR